MLRKVGKFLAGGVLLASAPAWAVTTVVTPADLSIGFAFDQWHLANFRDMTTGFPTANTTAEISGTYPRSGNGSVEFATDDAAGKADFEYYPTGGFGRLGDLTALSFDWYRDSASNQPGQDHLAPALRLYVANLDPATGAVLESGLLIWEDVYNGGTSGVAPTEDAWVSADVLADHFWMRAFGPGRTIDNFGITLPEWMANTDIDNGGGPIADLADADTPIVLSADTVVFGINFGVGSGWGGDFIGAVDNVRIGFSGSEQTWNFELRQEGPVIPEPFTAGLGALALGAMGLAATRRRR